MSTYYEVVKVEGKGGPWRIFTDDTIICETCGDISPADQPYYCKCEKVTHTGVCRYCSGVHDDHKPLYYTCPVNESERLAYRVEWTQ